MTWDQFVELLTAEGLTAEQYVRYQERLAGEDIMTGIPEVSVDSILDGSYHITLETVEDDWTNNKNISEEDVQFILEGLRAYVKDPLQPVM